MRCETMTFQAAFTPDTCSCLLYKYPGRATCIRIQVDTCRRDDCVADTGCRLRQGIQVDTQSGYNLYPGYMCQV